MNTAARDPLAQADQVEYLFAPVGAKGSGAVRYAAAVYFHNTNKMSAEMLEIYRSCSKFDHEDPLGVAAFYGVCLPDIVAPA